MTAISEYKPTVISQTSSMELNVANGVVNALRTAFANDLQVPPTAPSTWTDKTKTLLKEKYPSLPSIAQRSLHALSNLGNGFPDCSTLEAITRQVVRVGNFDKEKVLRLFQQFQERAKQAGNAPIFQTAAIVPAILPILDNLPPDERDFGRKLPLSYQF